MDEKLWKRLGWSVSSTKLTPDEYQELRLTGYVIRKDGTIITTASKKTQRGGGGRRKLKVSGD